MSKFQWDEEDPMATGFEDTEEESPVQPAPPPPSRPVARPAKPAAPAVAEVLEDLEESPDPAELTEAEWRLEKATYYRSVMNSQLLSSDHPAAIEVEQELQDWATGRLQELLGLKAESKTEFVQPTKIPFTEEEVEVLKAVANRVIAKQSAPQPSALPPREPQPTPKPAPVAPATAKPKPKVVPVETSDLTKRGRGRPRKPCRICGELVCEHKRKSTPEASPQAVVQPQQPRKLAASAPATGETYDGIPIQVDGEGNKFIEAANGKRYKLEVRTVIHKETGEQRQAYIPREISVIKKDPKAKAYPSEEEAMMMATAEAAKNLSAVSAIQAMTAVGGVPQKITGKTLIDAAMAAPEREEYIPEPPPRKR